MTRQRRALIIGGGIAGPAMALFLKRAGIGATIFEAYPRNESVGGGFAIAPNGMRVLESLGLARSIVEQGTPVADYCFRNDRGSVLARYANGSLEKFGHPSVVMPRYVLCDALREELDSEGIVTEYERRLTAIESHGSGVVARFADGSQAEGDFLIGADGIHSATRSIALPESPLPSFTGLIGVGSILPASAVPAMSDAERQNITFSYGANGFFGYCGAGTGKAMWWSNLPREPPLSRKELADLALPTVRTDMMQRFGGYHQPIPQLIEASESLIKINVFDIQSLPTWHCGRVVLIGDAAHAVSPNAGQGASMALEDAMYLSLLLRDSENYEQVFAQFEQDRKPRVERIVAEGRRRGVDKQIVSPFQSRVREVMMWVMLNLFGPHADDWLYKYRIDWVSTEPQRELASSVR